MNGIGSGGMSIIKNDDMNGINKMDVNMVLI